MEWDETTKRFVLKQQPKKQPVVQDGGDITYAHNKPLEECIYHGWYRGRCCYSHPETVDKPKRMYTKSITT